MVYCSSEQAVGRSEPFIRKIRFYDRAGGDDISVERMTSVRPNRMDQLIMFKDHYLGDEGVATGHLRLRTSAETIKACVLDLTVANAETNAVAASQKATSPQKSHAFFEIDIRNLAAGKYVVTAKFTKDGDDITTLTTRFERSQDAPRPDVSQRSVDLMIDDVVGGMKSHPVTVGVPMPCGILLDP